MKKKILSSILAALLIVMSLPTAFAASTSLTYKTHIANIGWQNTVSEGKTAGTTGKGYAMEAIIINLTDDSSNSLITYRAHVANIGWQGWKNSGQMAGTEGQSKAIEAIEIKTSKPGYDVLYRAHVAGIGWQDWVKNGATAGTTSKSKAIEAIEVKLVASTTLTYEAHIQDKGWMGGVNSGETAGTTGKNLRMEAIRINLKDSNGKSAIKYQTHVSDIGWTDWKNSGEVSGTTGKAKAIEALRIKFSTSEYSDKYDVLYRVHVANKGWLGWTKNGEMAGSEGLSLRVEAVEIKIVKKDSISVNPAKAKLEKPTLTYEAHVQDKGWMSTVSEGSTAGTTGKSLRMEALKINLADFDGNSGISYKAHVSDIGWQSSVPSGKQAGTTGKSKAIEAIQINLSASLSPFFDIYYRVHSADKGWLGWAKNGETAGTTGGGLAAQAIEIKLVAKDEPFNRGGEAYIDATPTSSVSGPVWPVGGNGGTDYRNWPYYNGTGGRHHGTDIVAPAGTPVYASYDGVIDTASVDKSYGNYIILRCNANNETVNIYFAHLKSYTVKKGQTVKAGELIGYVGSTGNSTGNHLHYEVRDEYKTRPELDPHKYLP